MNKGVALHSRGDQVELELAVEDQTCYKITLIRPRATLTGSVLCEGLPAIGAFVHRREKVFEQASEAELRQLRGKPGINDPTPKQGASDPLVSAQFQDFSRRDPTGKAATLSRLRRRPTVGPLCAPP